MKKKSLAALLLMLLPMLAAADIVEIKGVNYFLSDGSLTASVNKKNGGYKGDVVVPATVDYKGKTYQVTEVLSYAFSGSDELTSVVLPESVTKLYDDVFFAAHNLTSVKLPSTVTKWGDSMFAGCQSLTTVTLPAGLTVIPRSTFNGCDALTTIELSDEITKIGESAFAYCSALTTIKIPASVTAIEDEAFNNSGLTDIYCYATEVPEKEEYTFDLLDIEAATLHVPSAAVASYKKAWSEFVKVVAIE